MRTFRVLLVSLSATALLAVGGCSRVNDDWKAAQAADSTEAYQQFLKAHADSEFSTRAQDRVKQLLEERDWQQAAALDTRDAYEQFVAQHADGTRAQEARVRIENFKLTPEVAAGGTPEAVADVPTATVPAAAAPAAAQPAAAPKTVVPRPVAGKPVATKTHAASSGGSIYVQLGSFSSNASAQAEWKRLRAKSPKLLAQLKPHYASARVSGKTVYRLQVGQRSRDSAAKLCGALKKQAVACVVPAG
jgi:cell division septation protein DedD